MAEDPPRRKLIAFDQETWNALDLLARDSMKTVQELADEAFTDLLRKHGRPTDLKAQLKRSVDGGAKAERAPAPRRAKGRATSGARSGRRRASRGAE